jgi:citrate/tricarballylate utilization protein
MNTTTQPLKEQPVVWMSQNLSAPEAEVGRVMDVCNACRYCEGFCAVFQAMTRRVNFTDKADLHYLANLCHNCGACLHSCQYGPDHEFRINVPKAMAQVRTETYTEYAWPAGFGRMYSANGLTVAAAVTLGLVLFLVLAVYSQGGLVHQPLEGNFYAVFPHNTLVALFGVTFGFAVLALAIGVARFWKDVSPGASMPGAAPEAMHNALTLKYLDGGHGKGCNDENDRYTLRRRRFHHLTFYGFMLCLASTSVATVYHYALGWQAPYPVLSLPVLLGTLGGIGLIVGPAGLLWLNIARDPRHGDMKQRPMDRAFIALLFFTSLTGLALLAWRDTGYMALLLAIHLGVVMALFLTLPYGKFAHGVYRSAALLKWAIEKRMPNRVKLGAE